MHGIVLKGLKDFVVETHGADAWRRVQERAGVGRRIYVPVADYDDEEAFALVAAACEVTGHDQPALLAAFGRYLVTPLLETYGVHVDGDWPSLELLANTEAYVHDALRAKQLSTFTPPGIGARQVDQDRVDLFYGSDRQLCHLLRGIVLGVADHYGETFDVTERQCMLEGATRCEFIVERVPTGPGSSIDHT